MAHIKAVNKANGAEQFFTQKEWDDLQKKPKYKHLFKLVEAPEPPEVRKLKEEKKQQQAQKNAAKTTNEEK